MSLLERPEAKALLADAELSSATVRGCQGRLKGFLRRYLPLFFRREHRDHAEIVLAGRLSHLERKTCEPIAREAGVERKPIQLFVGNGAWDDESVMAELRRHVAEEFHDPDVTFVIDGSSFPKKGTESCGVERQWCGRLGKVDNCQVGVFLSCVSAGRAAPLDRQLYLPKKWASNAARRQKCHVPKSLKFAPKWKLALKLIQRSRGVPHGWVTADDEFGRVSDFRATLRRRGERYVLDVPCNTLFRVLPPVAPPVRGGRKKPPRVRAKKPAWVRADEWAAAQPASSWQRIEVRAGEKGPLSVDVLHANVETNVGVHERLLVIRTVEEQRRTHYCLSNAAATAAVDEIVDAHDDRHRIEEMFELGNGEVGFDHYEVRSWVGWHHHMTLTLLAMWFLLVERDRVGKKNTGHNGAASPRNLQPAAATPGSDRRRHRRHHHAGAAAHRRSPHLPLAHCHQNVPAPPNSDRAK